MVTIHITGPGGTFCFESEIIKRALMAEGVIVNVKTNYTPKGDTEEYMAEARRRMKGDWSEGKDGPEDQYKLGKVERKVQIIEDHQPWGG